MRCSVAGCEKKSRSRGWCKMHHTRWLRYGNTSTVLKRANGSGNIESTGRLRLEMNGKKRYYYNLIAERILGKPLPAGAEVHHVDGNPANNENSNLVICPDHAYHKLLHQRSSALAQCGHADWIKCAYCKQYGPRGIVRFPGYYHLKCSREYARNWFLKKRRLVCE